MKLPVRRRMVIPTVAAVAVVGGGSALVIRHGASGSSQYRTAVASVGTVTQSILLSGNLSPVGESDLDFGSSGRVTAVNVRPGQSVTAGEALATIDGSTLEASLTQAQAGLTSAQARLSQDQGGPTAQSLAQSQASVRSAQNQVSNAQTALTDSTHVDQAAIASAQSALNAAEAKLAADRANECSAPAAKPAATPAATPASTATPSPSPAPTPSCVSQGQVATDQAAVTQAQNALAGAQAKATQDTHQGQGQLSSAQIQLQNAQAALATLEQGNSAQQLAMDQSQVQIDQINVDNAQKALSEATITAPVAGIVGQVNITVGQISTGSPTASTSSSGGGQGGGGNGGSGAGSGSGSSSSGSGSSSTHAIVVLDPGAFEVVGTLTDAQINEVALGQTAEVTVAGASRPIPARVTGIAPEATVSSGVATFPVTVLLTGSNPSLHAGVSASVSLVINQVTDVLTVPSSAIRPSGGGDTVQTLVSGQLQTIPVTVGASDQYRTQIVSGLNQGDTVVIATVSGVVPTPNANSFFGGGGRGGGRGAGGGAGGAVTRGGGGLGG